MNGNRSRVPRGESGEDGEWVCAGRRSDPRTAILVAVVAAAAFAAVVAALVAALAAA